MCRGRDRDQELLPRPLSHTGAGDGHGVSDGDGDGDPFRNNRLCSKQLSSLVGFHLDIFGMIPNLDHPNHDWMEDPLKRKRLLSSAYWPCYPIKTRRMLSDESRYEAPSAATLNLSPASHSESSPTETPTTADTADTELDTTAATHLGVTDRPIPEVSS